MIFSDFSEWLSYDHVTGVITWIKAPCKGICVGDKAGSLNNRGYLSVKINGKSFLAHRIGYLLHFGELSARVNIDHINLDKTDNRAVNLRLASRSQNGANRPVQSNNKLGVKGIDLHCGKYRAQIRVKGAKIHLGLFSSLADAQDALIPALLSFILANLRGLHDGLLAGPFREVARERRWRAGIPHLAFFAIGAIIIIIHAPAVPFALVAKAIYALALPFQRLLNRLSAPKNVSHQ